MQDAAEHFGQFLAAIGGVFGLVAKPLAGQNEHSLSGDPIPKFGEKPLPNCGWDRRRCQDVPLQGGLRIDLVYVLATRTAAARIGEGQLLGWNRQFVIDFKH
jgi:hypothetical protein